MAKVHRNDSCPCGSGKKYKKCCMLEERNLANIRAGNREVIQEAVDWLSGQHGDAFAKWVEDVWFADLSEDERKGISTADPAIKSLHDTNLLEFIIAEGVFAVDADKLPVLQLILDATINLQEGQRIYLEQLGENPLRLYQVTHCDPGEGFDLQLHPLADGDRIYIEDKWVSRMLDVNDIVGLRLMQTGGCRETSGAVYHIPEAYVGDLVADLDAADADDYSRILFHRWLCLVAAHV
ncbi:MAG: SEC-C metal-binding domain-containing protein [Mariprofundaceae bacterium]